MTSKITFKNEIAKLPLPPTDKWPNGVWDTTCLKHGYMSMILFTPRIRDYQTPHAQDELYIVFKGKGQLITKNEAIDFVEGDVLFVQAGDEHHFENFSDDIVLWVVFWGPKGGEP